MSNTSTSPANKFSGDIGGNNTRLNDKDLFDALVDLPEDALEKQPGGSQTIPQDVLALIETARQLRGLDLPPARPAFKVVLRGKLLTQLINTPIQVSYWENLREQWQARSLVIRRKALQVAVAVATVMAVAFSSARTAYASQSALPGDVLYGVKTGIESVQLALASDEDKVDLRLAFADRRLEEIEALMVQERYDDVAIAAQALDAQLFSAAAGDDETAVKIKEHSSNAVNALLAVLSNAPEEARPALEAALIKIASRQGIPIEIPGLQSTDTPDKPVKELPNNNANKKPTNTPKDKPQKTVEAPGQIKKTVDP